MTAANDHVDLSQSAAMLSRMLQFGDSMFPVGAFSFSSGLESAVQEGVVTNVATLRAFRLVPEKAASKVGKHTAARSRTGAERSKRGLRTAQA